MKSITLLFLAILVLYATQSLAVSPRPGTVAPHFRPVQEGKKGDDPRYGSRWLTSKRSLKQYPFKTMQTGPAVSGHVYVPVLAGLYSDTPAAPVTAPDLQRVLFDGPLSTGTMADYYSDVSNGNLTISGTVYGWAQLPETETYYTGGLGCNGDPLCGWSNTDKMIEELVNQFDGAVDFGIYDNDGPDGIPNSGDDDGYVDVLYIVHPYAGAECGGSSNSMFSYSADYAYYYGAPLATLDSASGGGNILIDHFIITPAVSCEGGVIEIGVFCHEFGHFLGLPDLYDNYGRSGIGYWGLMGTGSWNTPDSPARMCGWSLEQLGWVDVIDIGWEERNLALTPVQESRTVYRMVLPTDRFRRRENIFPVTGHSFICGYNVAEADERGYRGGAGYGNEWNESIARTFSTDGGLPVIFDFSIGVDVEPDYDFVYVLLDHAGMTDTLASYTGNVGPDAESIDIGGFLPSGQSEFTLRFTLVSDYNFSDEDGRFDSLEGWSLNIDNISLTGGGNSYSCDFETDAGGWRNVTGPVEYFIAENRRRTGFDRYLPGEGMMIYHAENSIAYSYVANTGGITRDQTRGVVVEEADGDYDMINYNDPTNHGDTGDPWPGVTGNTSFTTTSIPSSLDNSGMPTNVHITGISSGSAVFRAGFDPPEIASFDPPSADKADEDPLIIDIRGGSFGYDAACLLSSGTIDIEAVSVEWHGENRIMAEFDRSGFYYGSWQLSVVNGDGQTAAAAAQFEVQSYFLSASAEAGRSSVSVDWSVEDSGLFRGCVLFRSEDGGTFAAVHPDTLTGVLGFFSYEDAGIAPDRTYRYRIGAYYDGDEEFLDVPDTYSIEDLPFVFDGNYPNPFSESTKISFFVPAPMVLRFDVYDVAGRRVDRISSGTYLRGDHEVPWKPDGNIPSGIYFLVIDSGRVKRTRKLVLLR